MRFLLSTTKIFLKKSYISAVMSLSFYFLPTVFDTLKNGVHRLVISAFMSWPKNDTKVTLERILSEHHEIEQHSQCPNVNRNSVIRVTENLRSHILFRPAMGFGSTASYWSGESKICNFIQYLIVLIWLFQENVLRLYIPMHKVFFMNTLQSFHDFNHNFHCFVQGEGLSIQLSLVSEQIPHLAILHDDDYKIRRWIDASLLENWS